MLNGFGFQGENNESRGSTMIYVRPKSDVFYVKSPTHGWDDHRESWLFAKDAEVLVLRYEDLMRDPVQGDRVAPDFLNGKDRLRRFKRSFQMDALKNCQGMS